MIDEFLKQTVTVTPKGDTAYDKWGNPTAGVGASADARVQEIDKRIQLDDQTFLDVSLAVWLKPSVTIANNDKVTWSGTDYRVVKIEKKYDENGTHEHTKVYCR